MLFRFSLNQGGLSFVAIFVFLRRVAAVEQFVLFGQGRASHCVICGVADRLTYEVREIRLLNVEVVLAALMVNLHDVDEAASEGLRVEFKTGRIKDIIQLFFGDQIALALNPAVNARFLQLTLKLRSNDELHFLLLLSVEVVEFAFESILESSNNSFSY